MPAGDCLLNLPLEEAARGKASFRATAWPTFGQRLDQSGVKRLPILIVALHSRVG